MLAEICFYIKETDAFEMYSIKYTSKLCLFVD